MNDSTSTEIARLEATHDRMARAKSDAITALRKAWWAGHVTTPEYRRQWAALAIRATSAEVAG